MSTSFTTRAGLTHYRIQFRPTTAGLALTLALRATPLRGKRLAKRGFKSLSSTDFAIRAVALLRDRLAATRGIYTARWVQARFARVFSVAAKSAKRSGAGEKKKPRKYLIYGALIMEADVGIEPAYTDLQSAA